MNNVYKKSTAARLRRKYLKSFINLETLYVLLVCLLAFVTVTVLIIEVFGAIEDSENVANCRALQNASVYSGTDLYQKMNCSEYYETGRIEYMRNQSK